MKFIIIGRADIDTIALDQPYAVISINTPSDTPAPYPEMPTLCVGLLRVEFADAQEASNLVPEPWLFDETNARGILEFARSVQDRAEVIVCQCDAGISRSSAVAGALSVLLNGSGSEGFAFNSARYAPNMRVYKSILETEHRLHIITPPPHP